MKQNTFKIVNVETRQEESFVIIHVKAEPTTEIKQRHRKGKWSIRQGAIEDLLQPLTP